MLLKLRKVILEKEALEAKNLEDEKIDVTRFNNELIMWCSSPSCFRQWTESIQYFQNLKLSQLRKVH